GGYGAEWSWCGGSLVRPSPRSSVGPIGPGPIERGPDRTEHDRAWAPSGRGLIKPQPDRDGPRSGPGGHADRVEGGLEASDRAIDVAELVEAEQPDSERREVLGFAALQGHSGRDLHTGLFEARSGGQLRGVGVDDDHAG